MHTTTLALPALALQRRPVLDLLDRIRAMPADRIPPIWPLTRDEAAGFRPPALSATRTARLP
jgi:hypothetical protein